MISALDIFFTFALLAAAETAPPGSPTFPALCCAIALGATATRITTARSVVGQRMRASVVEGDGAHRAFAGARHRRSPTSTGVLHDEAPRLRVKRTGHFTPETSTSLRRMPLVKFSSLLDASATRVTREPDEA